MSNVETDPQESIAGGPIDPAVGEPVLDLITGHTVALGGPRGFEVTRTLPSRGRRMVGAWCFLDSYGPHDVVAGSGMRVPAHPHIGLQTVSWLLSGEVMHRDSLGSEQLIRPGQLNLMTAGHGIAHSEVTPADSPRWLHGVQLWVALPDGSRSVAPAFEHHAELPVLALGGTSGGASGGASATVLLGSLGDVSSPARAYTPIVGADLDVEAGASVQVPLRPDWEYALVAMSGQAVVDGAELSGGPLLYLGSGRDALTITSDAGARLLLLGGEPFDEQLVMWWNFVARSHDEIVAARDQWTIGVDTTEWAGAASRFGAVPGPEGDPLPAPAMPGTRLRPRGRER